MTNLRSEVSGLRGKLDDGRDEIAELKTSVAVALKGEQAEKARAERAEAEITRLRAVIPIPSQGSPHGLLKTAR